MRLQRALRIVRKLYGARARRSYLGRTRAHIELRLLSNEELSAFSKALVSGFADLIETTDRALRVRLDDEPHDARC